MNPSICIWRIRWHVEIQTTRVSIFIIHRTSAPFYRQLYKLAAAESCKNYVLSVQCLLYFQNPFTLLTLRNVHIHMFCLSIVKMQWQFAFNFVAFVCENAS